MNELLSLYKKQGLIVQIIVGAIVLFLIYKAATWAKAYAQSDGQDSQDKIEINQLASQGVVPTYTNSNYESMADELEELMTGLNTSGISQGVSDIMKQLENDADFIELNKAFGMRTSSYDWFGSATDLADWIRSESWLDVNEINEQLQNQGLSKRF